MMLSLIALSEVILQKGMMQFYLCQRCIWAYWFCFSSKKNFSQSV